MRAAHPLLLVLAFASGAAAQTPPAPSAPALDFEFFKTRVQPIFLAERPGHARCIACHGSGHAAAAAAARRPGARPGPTRSRARTSRPSGGVVVPGSAKSRLLMHPLAETAGGDFYHNGGKHWSSQNDPEWQTLKAWVMGDQARRPPPNAIRGSSRPTAPATTSTSSIPPPTRSSASFDGIEAGHGAGAAPDGSRIYVSDEAESTLDVVDAKTLAIMKKVPLSGHPNNMAVGKDGGRVYVGIIQAPGGVDVIDTASMQRVKTVPTKGTIHNAYVTPDGKYRCRGVDSRRRRST